jgi:hypothetical protein
MNYINVIKLIETIISDVNVRYDIFVLIETWK